MPTILVTGCSSGFGLATARRFADRGGHDIATMRPPPPREDVLPPSDRLRVLPLDVTDPARIAALAAVADKVAEGIWRAVTDKDAPAHILAWADAMA
ncbi:SDR family NAD(P)-dependent oxidoreductase [Methylobacterium sp. J-030]|uniref:SDR family NAD(P)-dependent oxidoreductase n=1 Tax=Methylobacterium sp. J-030 TaxID=2836627 RepID=UPI0024441214|nr:SDR family NAD(P)-dependent oxidoreductase [Methylobacterium sp. J-030]